jgi:hypothetical protein
VRRHTFPAAGLLIVASAVCPLGISATPEGATNDPRLDMATALRAVGPHASLSGQAKAFARLVGAWDVAYTDITKAGKTRHRTGELTFGWVMDGRVLQDLWVVNPADTSKEREVYTDLFYFEPKSGIWRAATVDPYAASVATFVGSEVGDSRIVLESHDLEPSEIHRWSFNDISPDSLVFRDEASNDDGRTWRLKSEYHMKRRGAVPPV